MSIVVVAVPPVLVADTVYVVEEDTVDGVPEISPDVVSKFKPVGSDGVIDHETTVPPLTDGVSGVIVVPLVSVYGVPP